MCCVIGLFLIQWDGVYLDLDALLVKPLYDLERNFVTRESDKTVSAGILAFSNDSAGRRIAKEVLWYLNLLLLSLSIILFLSLWQINVFRELATTFDPNIFAYNGPGVMTRKFEMYCKTNNFSQMTMPTCKGTLGGCTKMNCFTVIHKS